MSGEEVEKMKPLYSTDNNVKCYNTLKNSLAVLQKLNIELPYDSAILLLYLIVYSREMKTYIHVKFCN